MSLGGLIITCILNVFAIYERKKNSSSSYDSKRNPGSISSPQSIFSVDYDQPIPLGFPDGPYGTNIRTLELIDYSRSDPFSPIENDPRKVMISAFYPTGLMKDALDHGKHVNPFVQEQYFPNRTAEILAKVVEGYGWPDATGDLQQLKMPVLPDDWKTNLGTRSRLRVPGQGRGKQSMKKKEFPVVLFSHGLGLSRLFSSLQASSIAMMGYVVITIDHPHDAAVVEYPDGTIVKGRNFTTVRELDELVRVRSEDVSFVLNEFGESPKVAMYGHALGGATAVRAAYDDERILGVINLDGSPYGFNTTQQTNASHFLFDLPEMAFPFALFNKPASIDELGMSTLYDTFTGYKRHLLLREAHRISFTDLSVLVEAFERSRLRDTLLSNFYEYTTNADYSVADYVADFMGMLLKGKKAVLLDKSSEHVEVLAVA